jgi:hypothetical protein
MFLYGKYWDSQSPQNAPSMGRAHTTEENGKWGETKQRSENQVAFNSVLGPISRNNSNFLFCPQLSSLFPPLRQVAPPAQKFVDERPL